ncbi:GLOBIN domain-containing protein [Aphelenchoides fujianensis]|nr:GLOBIN domain-containing protein [Aphelenchoides fujianensis]
MVESRMRPSASVNHLAPRPLRRCRSASPALPRPAFLTADQQALLRKSWSRTSKTAIGRSIYVAMNNKCPDLPKLFGADSGEIDRHERFFVDLIQSTMDNLADEGELEASLSMVGKAHNGFSIRAKHWDAFGEALVAVLTEWIGPGRQHKETIRAWILFATFMADRLSAAANSGGSPFSTPRLQLLTFVSVGWIKSANAGGKDLDYWREKADEVALYKVSDASGKIELTKVRNGPLQTGDLKSEDAFILDAGSGGLFVWIGKNATKEERAKAQHYGQDFLGKESPSFTKLFPEWNPKMWAKKEKDFKNLRNLLFQQ